MTDVNRRWTRLQKKTHQGRFLLANNETRRIGLAPAHTTPGVTGDRLVFAARGQAFVAPAEQGRFVEVPRRTRFRAC